MAVRRRKGNYMNELVISRNQKAVCSSLQVAEKFRKRHDNVMRDIEKLLVDSSKLRNENGEIPVMFQKAKYKAENGQVYEMYYMNRDGFSLLVMGFNGKNALEWKIKYIGVFNQIERLLTEKQSLPWQESRSLSKQIHNT